MEQIITVITNNTDANKIIKWTTPSPIWVGAHSSVDVPYEVWSCADRKQREGIIADTYDKSISLTVKILQDVDKVEYTAVAFDPSLIRQAQLKVMATAVTQEPAKVSALRELVDNNEDVRKHTITASSNSAIADFYGVEASKLAPETEDEQKQDTAGAKQDGPSIVEDSAVKSTAEKLKESEQEAALDVSNKEMFESYVKAKDWDNAYEFLKGLFGDKVTFSKHTIMSMKSWDKIIEKYQLIG